jgi:uncharacterized iron-regulated protein
MSGIPSGPTNRAMQDYNTQFTVTGPNGTTQSNGTLFDLGQVNAFPINEGFDIQVQVPAFPNNVGTAGGNGVTILVVNNATSNSANSSNVAGVAPIFIQGVASTGSAAANYIVKLPGGTLEFIGLWAIAANSSNPGVNNTATVTAQPLF